MYVYNFLVMICSSVPESYHSKCVNKLTWDIIPYILLFLKHAIRYDITKSRKQFKFSPTCEYMRSTTLSGCKLLIFA